MPKKPNKVKTKAQDRRFAALAELGCAIHLFTSHGGCNGRITIHHTHVGGSRPNRSPFKNHDKTIGLCLEHHQGRTGIDPPHGMGTVPWEEIYGTEDYFLEKVNEQLGDV